MFSVPLIKVKGCITLNGTLLVNYKIESSQSVLVVASDINCILGQFSKVVTSSSSDCNEVDSGKAHFTIESN